MVGIGCAGLLAVGLGTARADEPARAGTRLGGLFSDAPKPTAPRGPRAELDDIERQLDALSRRGEAAVAIPAIERGRTALRAARAALAAGERETCTRKQQIAWAALSVA